jgi:aspartate 1-decarboxylase
LVRPGDLVILASYGWMTEEEASARKPRVVFVDAKNRVVRTADEEKNPPVAAE